MKHIREVKDQFQAKVKMVKSKLQGGTQKEIVVELLGCVEHSTNGDSLGGHRIFVPVPFPSRYY